MIFRELLGQAKDSLFGKSAKLANDQPKAELPRRTASNDRWLDEDQYSKEPLEASYQQAAAYLAQAKERGFDFVQETEDGDISLLDLPLYVESPNPYLIISKNGEILSSHGVQAVKRIFHQIEQGLSQWA
jgi:hypothetical protein